MTDRAVEANGRRYALPSVPTVVVCVDGCDPGYIERSIEHGRMPTLASLQREGVYAIALSAMPSFTNPNNVSIVTGVPPSLHGICGNYFLDPETGQEVMMNDPRYLRAPTLLQGFAAAGLRVAAVTAKEKLRRLLGHGWLGICFSAEKAHEATLAENGIEDVLGLVGRPNPDVYDPELSHYTLEAGLRLLDTHRPDVLYLSTTDLVQHKHPPGSSEADNFYGRLDQLLGALHDRGVVIGLTGDHGMSDKSDAAGRPNVRYLETALAEAGLPQCRVVLPITDPYVAHHGGLGSFALVYLMGAPSGSVRAALSALEGVEAVLPRAEAARQLELPVDRIGDLVVLGGVDVVFGTAPDKHDLSVLDGALRSHGGLHERAVPFFINRPLNERYQGRLAQGVRNYDIFEFAFNGVA